MKNKQKKLAISVLKHIHLYINRAFRKMILYIKVLSMYRKKLIKLDLLPKKNRSVLLKGGSMLSITCSYTNTKNV